MPSMQETAAATIMKNPTQQIQVRTVLVIAIFYRFIFTSLVLSIDERKTVFNSFQRKKPSFCNFPKIILLYSAGTSFY